MADFSVVSIVLPYYSLIHEFLVEEPKCDIEAPNPCNKPNFCNPACQQEEKLANPWDCTTYFECNANYQWEEMPCGHGTSFNRSSGGCDHYDIAACHPLCPPYTGPSTKTTTETPFTSGK